MSDTLKGYNLPNNGTLHTGLNALHFYDLFDGISDDFLSVYVCGNEDAPDAIYYCTSSASPLITDEFVKIDMTEYSVVVGNVGTVHSGYKYQTAKSIFDNYVLNSKSGSGRCAGEPVTLLKDDEPAEEYAGEGNNE